tara:strand:+ start:42 stop:452 length:411 start_codon:yes stop_codon:yes gene_type:complete
MDELKYIYDECLRQKLQIEICYQEIKDKYMEYRINKFLEFEKKSNLIKNELVYYNENRDQINNLINAYKKILLQYMLYKKRIEILIKTQTTMDTGKLKLLIKDQQDMMQYVKNINQNLDTEKARELMVYLKDKLKK